MNSALQKIRGWRSLRERRALQRWEQIRTEGKTRFVIQSALNYGVVFVGLSHAIGSLFGDPEPDSLVRIIVLGLFGYGMGLSGWSDMESKYKRALTEGLQAPPPGKTLPGDQSSGPGESKA